MTATEKTNRLLKNKFRNRNGRQVRIFLFPPVRSYDEHLIQLVTIRIEKELSRLDDLSVTRSDVAVKEISYEGLRRAVSKTAADVLLIPSFREAKWSLTVYDRRNPQEIVLHSELLSEDYRKRPDEIKSINIARSLIEEAMALYAHDETFDLPQQDAGPMLQTDIPRWMASADLMNSINSEIKSRYYLSASVGGVVTSGYEDRSSSSSLLAVQVGYRPFTKYLSNLMVEIAGEVFNYNALVGGLKYVIQSKATTARVYLGMGYSLVTTRKSLAVDGSGAGLGRSSNYLVPSLAMVVPVGDILLKAETQYFRSVDERSNTLLGFLTGIFIPF